jgi:acyl-CoA thioesterase FadM
MNLLSLLVAAPNVTCRLQVKYSRPVMADIEHMVVTSELADQKGRELTLRAVVRDPKGTLLARARATHWIVD